MALRQRGEPQVAAQPRSLDDGAGHTAGRLAAIELIDGRWIDAEAVFIATIELETPPARRFWGMTREAH